MLARALNYIASRIADQTFQTSIHASIKRLTQANSVTLKFSRGISVALFVLYALYLQFLLRYHPEVAEGTSDGSLDEEAQRASADLDSQLTFPSAIQMRPIGILSDAAKSQIQPTTTETGGIFYHPPAVDHEFRIGMRTSVVLLICSACVVSICAEYMVNSIEHVVANARLTEAFLGLIILPLVGNTAELVTAVTVATKNKMDLAINVTVGSAIQITLFMVPAMVSLGWMTGKDVTLFFDMFQTVSLLVTMMMVNFLLLSGRTTYLLGAMLGVCYIIIGIGAFVLPNQNHKTHSVLPS
jgi:Ca2+:H+ antiporter